MFNYYEKPTEVKNKEWIQLCSVLIIILCIAEFVVGAMTSSFISNFKPGSWWGAIVAFITGCFGASLYNSHYLRVMSMLGFIAFIVSAIACILDGISIGFMNSLATCYSPMSNTIYGDLSLSAPALNCATQNNDFNPLTLSPTNNNNNCDCIYQSDSCKYGNQMGCVAIYSPITNDYYSCYSSFQLKYASSNCGELMGSPNTYYIRMLSASTALNASISLLLIVLITLGVIAINEIERNNKNNKNNNNISQQTEIEAIPVAVTTNEI